MNELIIINRALLERLATVTICEKKSEKKNSMKYSEKYTNGYLFTGNYDNLRVAKKTR